MEARSPIWAHDGADALLARLWTEDGRSVSEIAAALTAHTGRPVTRSAVTGRMCRLGLAGMGKRERGGRVKAEAAVAAKRAELDEARRRADLAAAELRGVEAAAALALGCPPPSAGVGCGAAAPATIVRPEINAALPQPGTWPLTDLRSSQCRFACTPDSTGPDGHRFCGEAVERIGSPYCAAHAARCFDRRAAEVVAAQRARALMARMAKGAGRGWGQRGA